MELVLYRDDEHYSLMHNFISRPKDQRRYANRGLYKILSILGIYHSDFYLFRVEDTIVGCIRVFTKRHKSIRKEWWICDVLIFPQYRGLGYSKIMVKLALERCGNNAVYLWVANTNKTAINLYKLLGFKIEKSENHSFLMKYEQV